MRAGINLTFVLGISIYRIVKKKSKVKKGRNLIIILRIKFSIPILFPIILTIPLEITNKVGNNIKSSSRSFFDALGSFIMFFFKIFAMYI